LSLSGDFASRIRRRKQINLTIASAGQAVGLKEVEEGIWPVSFMDCDLGYVGLKKKAL